MILNDVKVHVDLWSVDISLMISFTFLTTTVNFITVNNNFNFYYVIELYV